MQGHADRAFGHGRGAGPRGDHHGDAAIGGGGQVDQLDPHPGPRHDLEGGRGRQKRLVDAGVGPGDGPCGHRQVIRARVRNEPAVPIQHPGHQFRVDRPQPHHDRQATAHQACPNVAPGTGVTLCQAPSRAEVATAMMTSPSAWASAIVELRRSPPPTATRNFFASMTFRSS